MARFLSNRPYLLKMLSLLAVMMAASLGSVAVSGQNRPKVLWQETAYVWSPASDMALSPDAQTLAVTGESRIDLYRVSDGTCLRTLQVNQPGGRIAWSPDGTRIVHGDGVGHIHLYDPITGLLVARARTSFNAPVMDIAISPDGQFVVTASPTIATLDFRRLSDLRLVRRWGWPEVRSVAFSPDGGRLAIGLMDGRVRVLNASTGALLRTITGITTPVTALAFSPDGNVLAAGADDGTLRLYNPVSGALVQNLPFHYQTVLSLVFSPDGARLASAALDSFGAVWSMATSSVEWSVQGVFTVAFGPGATRVFVGGHGVREVDLVNMGVELRELATSRLVSHIAYDPTGTYLVTAGTALRLYNAFTGEWLDTFKNIDFAGTGALAEALAWSSSGNAVYVHYGLRVGIFDVASGEETGTFPLAVTSLASSAFARRAPRFVVTDYQGNVKAYDVTNGDLLWAALTVTGLRAYLTALSDDGTAVATAERGDVITVRELGDGSVRWTTNLPARYTDARALRFAPNGAEIAVGTGNGYLLLLNAATGAVTELLQVPEVDVVSIAYSADGSRLFVGYGQHLALVIRRSDGKILAGYGDELNRDAVAIDVSPTGTCWAVLRGDCSFWAADAPNTATPTILTMSDISASAGSWATLVAQLRDGGGAALPNQVVHFWRYLPWRDWLYIGWARTDDTGRARIRFLVEGPLGEQDVAAAFGGDEGYQCSFAFAEVTVSANTTQIVLPDRTAFFGQSVPLRAFLYAGTSTPLTGYNVRFTIDGTPVGTATTDIVGRAEVIYAPTLADTVGTYTLGARFDGDATYAASSATANLTIQKGNVSIWVLPRSVARGTATYLRAYVRNTPASTPAPGLTIGFELFGNPLGTAVTDATGRASLLYIIPLEALPGDYPLTCTFAGTAHFNPTSGTGTVTVLP